MRRIGARVFASKPTVIVLLLELFSGYVTASTAGDAFFGGGGGGVDGSTTCGINADSILGGSFGDVRPASDLNPVLVVEWFIVVSVLVLEALR